MIKNKLMLVAILGASVILPAAVQAERITVQIGDRPFYNHGSRYWEGDYEMIWVPGHMSRNHWVHGHYAHGERRRHDGDRHDDGQNYRHDGDRQ